MKFTDENKRLKIFIPDSALQIVLPFKSVVQIPQREHNQIKSKTNIIVFIIASFKNTK